MLRLATRRGGVFSALTGNVKCFPQQLRPMALSPHRDELESENGKNAVMSSSIPVIPIPVVDIATEAEKVAARQAAKPLTLKSGWKLVSELSKFKLSSLVVFTSGAGFLCYGGPIDWAAMAAVTVGTGLCAASASTFNQVLEKDRDAAMKRTRARPLPSGRISIPTAIGWGTMWGASGIGMLLATTNPVVAALGGANIVLYSGIYTMSKRYTEWNTWIGSLVGAIPPLMGYAAATGGSLACAEPWALGALLFLWQFPHFFALSWMYREDYARGKFAMVPTADEDGQRTADLIRRYSVYLAAFPLVTTAMDMTSSMFLVEGTLANAYLLHLSQKFYDDRTNANARRVFFCSLWYLPLLLGGFVLHSTAWEEQTDAASQAIISFREKLRSICIHEVFGDSSSSTPHLCAKIASDRAVEAAVDMAVENTHNAAEQLNANKSHSLTRVES